MAIEANYFNWLGLINSMRIIDSSDEENYFNSRRLTNQ